MAKLTARGQRELARAEKTTYFTPEQDDMVSERVTKYALRSDGYLLSQSISVFRPTFSFEPPAGRRHNYGWKVVKKLGKEQTVEGFRKYFEAKGYKVKISS